MPLSPTLNNCYCWVTQSPVHKLCCHVLKSNIELLTFKFPVLSNSALSESPDQKRYVQSDSVAYHITIYGLGGLCGFVLNLRISDQNRCWILTSEFFTWAVSFMCHCSLPINTLNTNYPSGTQIVMMNDSVKFVSPTSPPINHYVSVFSVWMPTGEARSSVLTHHLSRSLSVSWPQVCY